MADRLYRAENLHYWVILLLTLAVLWVMNRLLQPRIEDAGDFFVLVVIILGVIKLTSKIVKEGMVEKLRKTRLKYAAAAKTYDLCMQARKPMEKREGKDFSGPAGKNCGEKKDIEYFLEQEKGRSLHHVTHIRKI
ncbi:MAG: hypothetical protein HFH41_01505 [Lachnospiraceae bacterium]|nr:hypothetical protein [Lachnospiraceae bacterium]